MSTVFENQEKDERSLTMTYYIRHKTTGEDKIIKDVDMQRGVVTVDDDEELRLVDVIEEYEWRYDIW
jgi:hypothetical protein